MEGSPESFKVSSEAILGVIPVTAQLDIGSERLKLFLTNNRLIVAHLGKRGTAALATASWFGKLSAAIEDLFKGGRESRKTRRIEESSPKEILEADKDNFDIGYQDIVNVELDGSLPVVSITVLSKEARLRFRSAMDFDSIVELFRETLGNKLTIR